MKSLILVVEDNETTRDLVQTQLTFLGYRVTTAKNGAEAVAKAIAELPDLIVMDIFLVASKKRRDSRDRGYAPLPRSLTFSAMEGV